MLISVQHAGRRARWTIASNTLAAERRFHSPLLAEAPSFFNRSKDHLGAVMNYRWLMLLFFSLAVQSFGQSPSASPTPRTAPPTESRTLGSSLKKYERGNSQRKTKSEESTDEDVVRVATDLVVNSVLVTNQKGNLILGFQKDDFVVTEDGATQTIDIFSPSESFPRSIVLIMENSVASGPYQEKSIKAATALVDRLAPRDRMAIVTGLRVWANFTNNKDTLKDTLNSFAAEWGLIRRLGGSTGRRAETQKRCGQDFCSLLAILAEMYNGNERQPIVVFQSDGIQAIYLKPDKDTPYQASYTTLDRSGLKYIDPSYLPKFGFREVKEAIEKSRATIYSVIPGLRFLGFSKDEQLARAKLTLTNVNKFYGWNKESDLPAIIKYYQYAEADRRIAGQSAMFKVAELSGGFADFIESPEDAENVYSNILTVISNRYVIGYYPTNKNRDGKRREVKIQVRNHPEYIVTGRKAYVLQ